MDQKLKAKVFHLSEFCSQHSAFCIVLITCSHTFFFSSFLNLIFFTTFTELCFWVIKLQILTSFS